MARGADFDERKPDPEGQEHGSTSGAAVYLRVPPRNGPMAMEARCYHGGEGRTKMKPLKYAKRDHMGYLVYVIYLVIVILLRA